MPYLHTQVTTMVGRPDRLRRSAILLANLQSDDPHSISVGVPNLSRQLPRLGNVDVSLLGAQRAEFMGYRAADYVLVVGFRIGSQYPLAQIGVNTAEKLFTDLPHDSLPDGARCFMLLRLSPSFQPGEQICPVVLPTEEDAWTTPSSCMPAARRRAALEQLLPAQ